MRFQPAVSWLLGRRSLGRLPFVPRFDTAFSRLRRNVLHFLHQVSRDVADCNAWTRKAMQLLECIGSGYAESFSERFSLLDPYQANMMVALDNNWEALLSKWHLVSWDVFRQKEEEALRDLQVQHEQEMKELLLSKGRKPDVTGRLVPNPFEEDEQVLYMQGSHQEQVL